jgi:hypothetical protein
MGVEMATDPLNFLGAGLLGKTSLARRAAIGNNAERANLLSHGAMPEEIAKLTKAVDETGRPIKTYHGTPHVFDEINMDQLSPDSLYGRGYYTTADPEIASTYAKKGAESAYKWESSPKDIAQSFMDYHSKDPSFAKGSAYFPREREWAGKEDVIANSLLNAIRFGEAPEELTSKLSGLIKTPRQNVRQQYMDLRNPLNVDETYPAKVAAEIASKASGTPVDAEYIARNLGSEVDGLSLFDLLDNVAMAAGDNFEPHHMLKNAGFDSIKHTGGKVTGGKAHQVYIALDPSQVYAPWIAPAERAVPSMTPLLGSLLGYNAANSAI